MARTPANFKELLWDLARMEGLEPDPSLTNGGLTDVQTATVLLDLNRGYNAAYRFAEWEDAWNSDTLTPSAGIITYAALGDARRFTLWSGDPRPAGACVSPVAFKSSTAGVHPQTDAATVYAFWMPKCPLFTTRAYASGTAYAVGATVLATDGNVYECIQAGTGHDPVTATAYWRLLPVLACLREAVLELGMANLHNRAGLHGSANAARKVATDLLDEQAELEFPRVQSWYWTRRAEP